MAKKFIQHKFIRYYFTIFKSITLACNNIRMEKYFLDFSWINGLLNINRLTSFIYVYKVSMN